MSNINTTYGNVQNTQNVGSSANNFSARINVMDRLRQPSYGHESYGKNLSGASDSVRNSVQNVRSGAENLRSAVNGIAASERNALSGNNDIMEVLRSDTSRVRSAAARDFNVDIVRLATTQVNEGKQLEADASARDSGFSAGRNQIMLESGGRSFGVSFNVSENDTNRDVQQKMADAINRSGAGVNASVQFDEESGASSLRLESAQTGVTRNNQPNFTVSGAASDTAGLNNITQEAQNAAYRVNRNGFTGALQTSRTNDADLGNGITARLKDTGQANVTMAQDSTAQINSFRNLVNAFNALMEEGQEASSTRNMSRLERDLRGAANTFSSSLENAGITMNRNGYLQINEDKMKEAAENGNLARLGDGSRSSGGFAARLAETADNITRNAVSYANNGQSGSTNNQTFDRYFRQTNQWNNMGLLFNGLF